MLKCLDIILFAVHSIVILFNLTGWIWQRTRRLHFWMIIITLLSWFLLGLRYGLGYCFLTDWHWGIKRELGEINLPASFIQYVFEQLGITILPETTDLITLLAFIGAVIASIWSNFFYTAKSV